MSNDKLTKNEAYLAMYTFLKDYFKRGGSEEVGALLGGMSLLSDGSPADAVVGQNWDEAVERAINGDVDAQINLR